MALIRGKDTKPEMVVRRLVHRLGYRFRLHKRTLPGKPDLVCSFDNYLPRRDDRAI
jgi:DNA mismatch endonuclease (patch repair protein)